MVKRIRFWLQSNLGTLALALALAVTVWVIATLEGNPFVEDDFSTPIEIQLIGLQPGLMITNDYTKSTRVRIEAQQNVWGFLSAEDITVTADLSERGPGTHQVPLQVTIAPDVQAAYLSAKPDRIRVEIEEEGIRRLPVRLVVEGEPATGYSLGNPRVDPSTVTVQGPISSVDLVGEIRVQVSVEDQRETFSDTLTLVALDNEGNRINNVTIAPSSATITIPIKHDAGYKDVSIRVVTTGRPPQGYFVTGLTPTPLLITVQGDPEVIEDMQPYVETQPIDLTGLTDDLIITVPLELPPGVTPIDTQTVEVLISIAAQQGSRSLTLPVQVIGLGEGLKAELVPVEIELFVFGPLPVLDALDLETDIIVTIDLTDLVVGAYQIEPQIEIIEALRNEISIESFFPVVIEVEITIDTSPEDQ